MDGIPEIKAQAAQEEVVAASAPPPPTEVKIRTMRSDIATMAASGGGLPRFQNVRVSGLSLETVPRTSSAVHKSSAILVVLITAIAVVVLGVLGYFGYRILTTGSL